LTAVHNALKFNQLRTDPQGEKASFNTYYIAFESSFSITQNVDLQQSLETISFSASLVLANGQHYSANKTITNAGQISLDDASFSSVNLINAGQISGSGYIDTSIVVNTAMMTASGGQLNLSNTIENIGGTVSVADTYGDVLHLNNTDIIGGAVIVAEKGLHNSAGNLSNVLLSNWGLIVTDNTALNLTVTNGSANTGIL
jgi:hypothetical protein